MVESSRPAAASYPQFNRNSIEKNNKTKSSANASDRLGMRSCNDDGRVDRLEIPNKSGSETNPKKRFVRLETMSTVASSESLLSTKSEEGSDSNRKIDIPQSLAKAMLDVWKGIKEKQTQPSISQPSSAQPKKASFLSLALSEGKNRVAQEPSTYMPKGSSYSLDIKVIETEIRELEGYLRKFETIPNSPDEPDQIEKNTELEIDEDVESIYSYYGKSGDSVFLPQALSCGTEEPANKQEEPANKQEEPANKQEEPLLMETHDDLQFIMDDI